MSEICTYATNYRAVLEKKLGRKLRKNEQAHHVNGCRRDRRPENLIAVSRRKHRALHRGDDRSKICKVCGGKKYGSNFTHVRVPVVVAERLSRIAKNHHRRGIQIDANLAILEYVRVQEALRNRKDNGR